MCNKDRCEQYTRAASALELQALPQQDITKLLLGKEHSLLPAPLLALLSVCYEQGLLRFCV